jgi:beta-glucosidase
MGKHNLVRAIVVTGVTAITLCAGAQTKVILRLNKSNIKQVIAGMTLEEKARMVVGTGMRAGGSEPLIGNADGRVPGAAGNTFSLDRFGIPGTVLADGPAGVRIEPFRTKDSARSYHGTAWPVGTLLASSWDTALLKRVGVAFGNEIKEYGIDFILAPGMNIHRDPLCGRNFEYFSEDPLISGYMAAAMVKGIQSRGIGTSIKHLAANNQESNRRNVNVIISERALREIYLKGFEIAVKESNPLTVMSSYNKINGTYTSQRADLLTTLLRKEWGFKGFVMSDWLGGDDPIAQLKAGNDLIMPGDSKQVKAIIAAVNNGSLSITALDQNVAHLLAVIVQTPSFQHYAYTDQPDLKGNAIIARETAGESMVLLKNEANTLPLQKGARLALFGNTAYETIIGGTGSGDVHKAYSISLADGMEQAGYTTNASLKEHYKKHIAADKLQYPKRQFERGAKRMVPEMNLDTNAIPAYAAEADCAIISIGRNAGEGVDRKLEGDFYLGDAEKSALKSIAAAFHAKGKRVIVVLNICGVMETVSWRNSVDAILLAWQPGQEGGAAMADIISGKVNPSGKLATTFPVTYADVPSAKFFPGIPADNPANVTYEEGIYVGYRYYNTFQVKPAYAFGYGLSYTRFSFSNIKLSNATFHNEITVMATVTNTGKRPGKEVVQLYLTAPAATLQKPAEELKAFAKTKLLLPGQSQVMHFTIPLRSLASFDPKAAAWMAEAGTYTVKIGNSSLNISETKTFLLPKPVVVEKVTNVLQPLAGINELKR